MWKTILPGNTFQKNVGTVHGGETIIARHIKTNLGQEEHLKNHKETDHGENKLNCKICK